MDGSNILCHWLQPRGGEVRVADENFNPAYYCFLIGCIININFLLVECKDVDNEWSCLFLLNPLE